MLFPNLLDTFPLLFKITNDKKLPKVICRGTFLSRLGPLSPVLTGDLFEGTWLISQAPRLQMPTTHHLGDAVSVLPAVI